MLKINVFSSHHGLCSVLPQADQYKKQLTNFKNSIITQSSFSQFRKTNERFIICIKWANSIAINVRVKWRFARKKPARTQISRSFYRKFGCSSCSFRSCLSLPIHPTKNKTIIIRSNVNRLLIQKQFNQNFTKRSPSRRNWSEFNWNNKIEQNKQTNCFERNRTEMMHCWYNLNLTDWEKKLRSEVKFGRMKTSERDIEYNIACWCRMFNWIFFLLTPK